MSRERAFAFHDDTRGAAPVVILAELVFPGIDPVALHLGPVAVRWYGLAYLVGFLIAGVVLDKLARDGFLALSKTAVGDLLGWLVVGVIGGGRLGYAAFYEPRMLAHPIDIVKVWEGGLSFHGGLLGVVIASALFARRHHIAWRRLADGLVLAAPFGIFLVRCANFINAELYGRIAPATLPWGVRFPTDPAARLASPELAAAGSLRWHDAYEALRASGRWEAIAAHVPLRHPSQLYEATLEGLLLGALLWWAYVRWGRPVGAVGSDSTPRRAMRPGALGALFLIGYATARFLVEFTRQPDAQFVSPAHPLGTILGPLSMGQLLSLLVAAGAALLLWFRPTRPADPPSTASRL